MPIAQVNGSGSYVITVPKEKLDNRGMEAGERVVLLQRDDLDSFGLYFPGGW